jgi:hypothetical protein
MKKVILIKVVFKESKKNSDFELLFLKICIVKKKDDFHH